MEAKDLMIGDWVFDEQMGIPVPVCSIREGRECLCRPIPLTPEILKKNGFEDISDHTLKGCDTFRLDIEQRGFDYCVTIKLKDYFKLQSYDDRWYTICEMEFGCNYVHELQRALKLCNIDKEIIL